MRIELTNLRKQYREVLAAILEHGEMTSPRGRLTREVVGMELVIEQPWDVLPVGTGRGVNTKIAALEALQLIGGVSKEELLVKAVAGKDGTAAVGGTPFIDAAGFAGAYGPRIRTQLPALVWRLCDDADTRGAVLQLWDPVHDLMSEDGCSYMCTVALQFLVRDNKLQLHAMMRSNDAWLGLPYDAFMFTQLQLTVANVLKIDAGPYHHRATSMHLYEPHWEKAGTVTAGGATPDKVPYGLYGSTARDAQLYARELLGGKQVEGSWYSRTIAPLFS